MLDANTLPQTDDDWPKIDESFHRYLVMTAGNQYLTDFVDRQGATFSCCLNGKIVTVKRRSTPFASIGTF